MKMKVLLIDPVTATITDREWDGKLETLYKWMRCDMVVPVKSPLTGVALWVDEEGLMKADKTPQWFCPNLWPQKIVGAGVVTSVVQKRDVPSELKEKLMKDVRWGLLYNPHGPVAGGKH